MRPPVTQAASIASRIARAARAAEKSGSQANNGEIAVALKQLKKVRKSRKAADSLAHQDAVTQPQVDDETDALSAQQQKDVSKTARYKGLLGYRNLYTYYPHKDYPLGDSISKFLSSGRTSGPSGKDKFPDNVEVVSPALCDDIINYIGPHLDRYRGCDIIDIHPGACLWSQKVHDYLKPRRHLLLEPDERYVDPCIKPLLDRKDSAYRHSFLPGAHPKSYWETYDHIFNDDLLPKRDALADSDPRRREPNNSLLVIGSLVRRYSVNRVKTNAVHFPSLIMHQLAEAAQTNRLFQRYGLVRMLLWIPEENLTNILPDSVLFKQGYSVTLEAALDIVQVAGGDRSLLSRTDAAKKFSMRQRRDQLDTWSSRRVLASMQDKGMAMPEHRRPEMHKRALECHDEDLRDYNPIRLPEGSTLQQALAHHGEMIVRLEEYVKLPKSTRKEQPEIPHKYKFTSMSEEALSPYGLKLCGSFVDVWGLQLALEHEYDATKADTSEQVRSGIESRLIATNGKISELFELLTTRTSKKIMTILLDELFALCREKPMLAWDRRPFEPLTVSEEEFWPRFPMQLLDIKPRPEALGDDLMNTAEANQVRRGLVKALFTHPASPLLESIDRLGAGARNLVVPEFKDSLAGGRIDPSSLLTKDITSEQLNALTKAYIEWPFRPRDADAIEAQATMHESAEF